MSIKRRNWDAKSALQTELEVGWMKKCRPVIPFQGWNWSIHHTSSLQKFLYKTRQSKVFICSIDGRVETIGVFFLHIWLFLKNALIEKCEIQMRTCKYPLSFSSLKGDLKLPKIIKHSLLEFVLLQINIQCKVRAWFHIDLFTLIWL